jgi:CRP/FNR family transcriptional regulator
MDSEIREALLRTLPFWNDLTEEQKSEALNGSRMKFYKKGSPAHNRCCGYGECLGLLIVKTGEIRTFILSQEGREVTIFRLFRGDVCMFAENCVIKQISFDTHIVADEDTYALLLSADAL